MGWAFFQKHHSWWPLVVYHTLEAGGNHCDCRHILQAFLSCSGQCRRKQAGLCSRQHISSWLTQSHLVMNLGSLCISWICTFGVHFDWTVQVLTAPGKYLPAYFHLQKIHCKWKITHFWDPNCMIQIHHQERKVWVPKICSQNSCILGINCACWDACLLWIKQYFRLLGHSLTSTTDFMHVSFCLPAVNDRLAFKCFCRSYICFGCQTKQAIMSPSK